MNKDKNEATLTHTRRLIGAVSVQVGKEEDQQFTEIKQNLRKSVKELRDTVRDNTHKPTQNTHRT